MQNKKTKENMSRMKKTLCFFFKIEQVIAKKQIELSNENKEKKYHRGLLFYLNTSGYNNTEHNEKKPLLAIKWLNLVRLYIFFFKVDSNEISINII